MGGSTMLIDVDAPLRKVKSMATGFHLESTCTPWNRHNKPNPTATPRRLRPKYDNDPLVRCLAVPRPIWRIQSLDDLKMPQEPQRFCFHDPSIDDWLYIKQRPAEVRIKAMSPSWGRRSLSDVEQLTTIDEQTIQIRPESLITESDLEKLGEVFATRKGISAKDFIDLVGSTVGVEKKIPRRAISAMFSRIDAYRKGEVTWQEICDYLLQESRMRAKFESTNRRFITSTPADILHTRIYHPHVPVIAEDLGLQRVLMFSQDGTITFWGSNLDHKKTKSLKTPEVEKERSLPKWYTDFTTMPQLGKALAITGDKELQIFDMPSLTPSCQVTEIQMVPLRMTAFVPTKDELIVVMGDMSGSIMVLHVLQYASTLRTWAQAKKKLGIPTTTFDTTIRKRQIKVYRWKVHNDLIESIQYAPTLKQIISCSSDPDTAVVIGCTIPVHGEQLKETALLVRHGHQIVIPAKRRPRFDEKVLRVPYGVRTLAVWDEKKILAAGGIDRIIRVWNMFMHGKPAGYLRGHTSPIYCIQFHHALEVLISISAMKSIKIWDLKEYTELHNLSAIKSSIRGQQVIFFYYSNVVQKLMVQTSDDLFYMSVGKMVGDDEIFGAHRGPIIGLGYNGVFNYIITCSEDQIKVWDICTGNKVNEFKTQKSDPTKSTDEVVFVKHYKEVDGSIVSTKVNADAELVKRITTHTGTEHHVDKNKVALRKTECPDSHHCGPITCLYVENDGERLLTGHQKGIVKEWNFSNGMCLKSMYHCRTRATEYAAVRYAKFHKKSNILAVGWDRKINIFSCRPQVKAEEPEVVWPGDIHGHKEDVWAIASCEDPEIIATASFDGTIILWNFSSGHIDRRLSPPDFKSDLYSDSAKVTSLLFYKVKEHNQKEDVLLFAAGPNNMLHAWDIIWKKRLFPYRGKVNPWGKVKDCFPSCMVQAQRVDLLAAGSNGGHVLLFDMKPICTGGLPTVTKMWKAHRVGVRVIDIIEIHRMVVTGSNDGCVTIWTYNGHFVGTFGQKKPWNIYDSFTFCHPSIPTDVLLDITPFQAPKLYQAGDTFKRLVDEENLNEVILSNLQTTSKLMTDEEIALAAAKYKVPERNLPDFLCFQGKKIVYKGIPNQRKSLAPVGCWHDYPSGKTPF